MLHISNIRHSELIGLQKYIPSKEKKDLIGYGGLHTPYKPINRPLLVIVWGSNGNYIF